MTDYRGDGPNTTGTGYNDGPRRVDVGPGTRDDHVVERKSGGIGRTLLILAAIAALIAAVLFATGFWKADMKGGALPSVAVDVKGGAMPDVDVDSKRLEVGTKETTIEVPKVETKTETVDVPVVGVSDGEGDKK
jgi:hypothetical protein